MSPNKKIRIYLCIPIYTSSNFIIQFVALKMHTGYVCTNDAYKEK